MRKGCKCAFVIVCAAVTAMCGDRGAASPPEASAVTSPAPVAAPAAAAVEPKPVAQAIPGATLAPPHEASAEFQDKLKEYLALRAKVESGLPKLTETKDPGKIAERSALLATGIQEARRSAAQGDIFTPKAAAEFRRILTADAASRTAKEKANIMNEVPAKAPQVNALYPVDSPTGPAALASFPAKLLGVLPELPETVEYRFLGQSLVLRDASANIIVDFLPGVAPGRSGGGVPQP
jgi:hypothetical protein